MFKKLTNLYDDQAGISFLSRYEAKDVAAVVFDSQSTSQWIISPPYFERLKTDLVNNVTIEVQFEYNVIRMTNSEKTLNTVSASTSFILNNNSSARLQLINMLNNFNSNQYILLPFLFPKFLMVIL